MLLVKQLNIVLKAWQPLVTSVRWKYPKALQDMIKCQAEPNYDRLPNQLTVASQYRPNYHVTVGIFIDAGSRYETTAENGMAHFFEHLVFKKTVSRNSQALEKLLAGTGARFKCFSEREMLGYYAECLPGEVPIIIDLLADCVFRNKLEDEEIELQRQVAYREMELEDVDMTAVLFDYLHGAAYFGTSLAQSVLGPSTNLDCFNSSTLSYYLNKMFLPYRTVLAAVGNIDHCKLLDLAGRHLSGTSSITCVDIEYRFTAGDFRYRDDALPYCSTAFAWEVPALIPLDTGVIALDVAGVLVGAWDSSQPGGHLQANHLGQAAHSGISDGYKSFYFKYKQGGLWGCQAFTDVNETEDWVYNYGNELMRFCTMLADPELQRGKNALKAYLLSRYENTTKSCIDLARWTLYAGCEPTLYQRITAIDALTLGQFTTYMDKYIYDVCPVVAAVGPCEQLLNYSRICKQFYWLRT